MNLPHLLYLLLLPTLTSSSSTLDLSYTTSTLPSTLPPTVTSLSLSNLNLKTVPPLIDNNLLTVDLSNNLLTLPSVLSVFKSEKIEEINLSFNPLFTSPPLKLNVTTSSIKTLNLSNTVTKTPDHLIKFLTNYKTLDSLIISRNDLKTALKLPLVTKHLDISYNPLHISSILKLKFYPECLILDGLKDPSNSVLDLLPKIVKKCSLRSCSLTSKSILKSILLNPNNLTEIDLSCNPLIPPFGSETINLKSLKKGLKKEPLKQMSSLFQRTIAAVGGEGEVEVVRKSDCVTELIKYLLKNPAKSASKIVYIYDIGLDVTRINMLNFAASLSGVTFFTSFKGENLVINGEDREKNVIGRMEWEREEEDREEEEEGEFSEEFDFGVIDDSSGG